MSSYPRLTLAACGEAERHRSPRVATETPATGARLPGGFAVSAPVAASFRAWRRLRARLARRLAHEAYWQGWEDGNVAGISRLAEQIGGGA